jgi:hypothetical protein
MSDMFHINRLAVLDTMIDSIWKWCSRQVWPVNRGCLLLLGSWSHAWYIQMSMFSILWIVFPTCMSIITVRYLCHSILQYVIKIPRNLKLFWPLVLEKKHFKDFFSLCDITNLLYIYFVCIYLFTCMHYWLGY